jgi:hypothetical protein
MHFTEPDITRHGARVGICAARRLMWMSMWVLGATVLAACASQHFADNGSSFPSAAKTIYVELFYNQTRVPGINDEFMPYLKDAIASRGRLAVVDDPKDADLLLSGKILFATKSAVGLSGVYEPLSYGDMLFVAATLKDRRTNKVIWNTSGISESLQTPVVAQAVIPTTPQFLKQNLRGQDLLNMTDMQVTATQQAVTRTQLMQQLASELYADMAWGL